MRDHDDKFQANRIIRRTRGARNAPRKRYRAKYMWILGICFKRSFESISLKLDGMVGTMKNWNSTVFGSNLLNEEGARGHAISRIFENDSSTPNLMKNSTSRCNITTSNGAFDLSQSIPLEGESRVEPLSKIQRVPSLDET